MAAHSPLSYFRRGLRFFHSFPEEVLPFIQFMDSIIELLHQEKPELARTWDSTTFTFSEWISKAAAARHSIRQYGDIMRQNATLFAAELFDDGIVPFSVYCLDLYINQAAKRDTAFAREMRELFAR